MTSDVSPAIPDPSDDSIFAQIQNRPSLGFVLGAVALFAITLLAYVRMFNAEFIWDDDYYVTKNTTLRSGEGIQRIWFEPGATTQYYPMVHTSFWIEYRLWGLNPRGYHFTNVLLHALGASLLWTLLKRLNIPGAWAAAAIFALHPLNVESVAWIAERKNVLSGVFFFGAMLVYLRYCGLTPAPDVPVVTGPDGKKKEALFSLPADPNRLYGLVVVLFAAALLSKSVTASLPAIVLVIIWWKRGKLTANDIVPLIPLFAMGIAMGIYTSVLERDIIGASGRDWDYAPTLGGEIVARFIIAGRAIWFYVAKIVAPVGLIFNYPRFDISPNRPLLIVYPLMVVLATIALWGLRSRLGRAPIAAWLIFIGALFPVLGFLNVYPMRYSFVADHFAYLPSIALIVLFVASIKRASDRWVSQGVLTSWAAPAAAAMLLILYAAGTLVQTAMYRDYPTLLTETLKRTSQKSWWAANNYADWILNNERLAPEKRLADGEAWARKTMRLKPDHPEARIKLGLIAMQRGKNDEALKWFEDAVAQQPNHPLAQFNVARMLDRAGRSREALAIYEKLVAEQPTYADARRNLGVMYAQRGRLDEAIPQYAEVIKLDPESPDAHYNMGQALLRIGRAQEAFEEFQKVLELQPKNTQVRLTMGNFALEQERLSDDKRWGEAERQYAMALSNDPNLAQAYHQIGVIRYEQGRTKDAIEFFQKAVDRAPRSARLKASLEAAQRQLARETSNPPTSRPTTRRWIPPQLPTTRRGSTQPSSMISAPESEPTTMPTTTPTTPTSATPSDPP